MAGSLNVEESLKKFSDPDLAGFRPSPKLSVAVLGRSPTYTKNFRTIARKLWPKIVWQTDKWKITHRVTLGETERHSVEHIPPPGWTVYILYPTDRSNLNPDLNQNRIVLFLSPNQLIQLVSSKSVHNVLKYCIMLYIVFDPISQWWRIT